MRLIPITAIMVGCTATQALTLAAPQVLETRLTQTPGVSSTTFTQQSTNRRSVATFGDQVHVVWMEQTTLSPSTFDILYRRSDDRGDTWTPPVDLSDQAPNDWAFSPTIAVDGQDVHVAWIDDRDNTAPATINFKTYYRRSVDGGLSWEPRLRLAPGPRSCENVALAISQNDVHVVYQAALSAGANDIFQVRSADKGATWGTPVNLTNDPEASTFPDIAFDGDDVHLVWSSGPAVFPESESYVMHSVSTDRGATFGASQSLTSSPARSLLPSLAISEGSPSTVHVAWDDDRAGWDIFYARSVDGGATWGPELAVTTTGQSNYSPFLAADGANVYLAFVRLNFFDWSLRSIRSSDTGATWSAEEVYTENQEALESPSMALDGDLIHTVWTDHRHALPGPELYYRREGSTGSIGSSYCGPAALNSTGASASIIAAGTAAVGDNDVRLIADGMPAFAFGFFVTSQSQGFTPNAGGSSGNLCLAGTVGRYSRAGEIMNSGANGSIDLALDLTDTPQPMGAVPILAGQTWNFQAWFRDSVAGLSTSNFTDGLSVSFQ